MEGVALCVALGVTAIAFGFAWSALGPDSLLLPPFNSDSAVPVLMSNETHWDVFHAYYWGQDRFGAWPFLLAHALSVAGGKSVTPPFLHAVSTLFVLLGAVPAALLARPYAGLGLLAYTVAVLLPESRGSLFELAQLYPFQLPLLFWAWWCIRSAWRAQGSGRLWAWLSLATLICFLATWTSVLSGPLLLAVTGLEGLTAPGPAAKGGRRWVLQLLPCMVGMAGEAVLRWAFHRFVRATYQRRFHSEFRVDDGHLLENTRQVWLRLETPALLAALAVLLAYSLFLFSQTQRGRHWSPPAWTVVGAFLVGLLPLPVLALVRHVRANNFADRYFTPSYFFLVFAALLAATSVLPERWPGRAGRLALLLGTLGLSAVALALLPGAGKNPDYARMQQAARTLAERAPGALLLDGYWGTYVFAALAPPGALLPLPVSGDYNRMPAYEALLPDAREVVVGHRGVLSGPPGSEPLWLFQYGTLLEREQPGFLSDGVDSFSLYRPRTVRDIAYRAEPSLEGLSLTAGAEVTVRSGAAMHATAPTTVLALELGCRALSPAPSGSFEDAEGHGPLRVEQAPGVVFFFSEGDEGPVTLHLVFGSAPCLIRRARWFAHPDVGY